MQRQHPAQHWCRWLLCTRFDSAGNFGLGTSLPAGRLHVAGQTRIQDTANAANYILIGSGANAPRGGNSVMAQTSSMVMGTEGAAPLIFITNAAEGMRLDSSGNLGLGVTPVTQFAGYRTLQIASQGLISSDLTSNGELEINNNAYRAPTTATLTYINSFAATKYAQYRGEHRWFTAASGTAGNPITFTQAMSLDNNGSFTVTTRALALVGNFISNVAGDVSQPAVFIQKFDNNSTTSQIFMRFVINNQGNACGQITANGANTAAFGTVSDERLKNNIVDLPSQLDNILALRPVEFDYIESEGGGHQLGFIAQEVQAVYPDLVGEREDGMLTLTDMNKNDARLIKAFQELAAKVTALEAEIAALKGAA